MIDATEEAKSYDKETNIICETKSFYILLAFLLSLDCIALITIPLLFERI